MRLTRMSAIARRLRLSKTGQTDTHNDSKQHHQAKLDKFNCVNWSIGWNFETR
jgi:hypothetical protein